MSKKRSIILSIIFLLIVILISIRIAVINSKTKTSINDFSTIKELVEYDGHKYINTIKSEEEQFEKDIYIQFSKEPIEQNGNVNQNLYEILISHISGKMLGNNFRIIDTEKDITIRIKFDKDKVSTYTINNDYKYWKNLKETYQINSYNVQTITNFTINSSVLKTVINNNWNYNINLGSKDSNLGSYDIYYDEGYKIRTINSKIYNIVFTKKYTNEIINQITTSTNINEVKQILGQPTMQNNVGDIIGYKQNDIYIFFGNNEISVYPVEKYNQTKNYNFAKLVTELNKTGDVNTFLNRLTDLYPDYETYYRNNSYVNIVYPLKGFEVKIGMQQGNGITIYNNYQGKVTEEVSIQDIIQNKKTPTNIYTKFNTNLVFNVEETRILKDIEIRNPNDNAEKIQTDEYIVLQEENIYKFISKDKTKIDSELEIKNFTSIVNYGQNIFIYGVKNEGIYVYNAENKQLTKIIEGQENFNVISLENNILYYDNKFVQI